MKIEYEFLHIIEGRHIRNFIDNKYYLFLVPIYDPKDYYWILNKLYKPV